MNQTWGMTVIKEILCLGTNESTTLFSFISAKKAPDIPPGLYFMIEPLIVDDHSYSILHLWREEDDDKDEDKYVVFNTDGERLTIVHINSKCSLMFLGGQDE